MDFDDLTPEQKQRVTMDILKGAEMAAALEKLSIEEKLFAGQICGQLHCLTLGPFHFVGDWMRLVVNINDDEGQEISITAEAKKVIRIDNGPYRLGIVMKICEPDEYAGRTCEAWFKGESLGDEGIFALLPEEGKR